MPEPIRLTRDQLSLVFSDFETMRQFELVLNTLNELSNTTLISLQAEVDQNTTDIATNTSDIATNSGDIASNVIAIAANTANISTNSTNITLKANIASPTFTGTVTIPNLTVTGTVTGIVKSDVGLGNVDNTSDANKPVSTAQQTALDLKAPLASPSFAGDVSTSGDSIRVDTSKTPSSASDTGTTGEIAWDSNYLYVCTATDTWKRVAISTW